ncbi:MAG: TlpA disulfide reductase family protein [Nocardioidaceae bacterium]
MTPHRRRRLVVALLLLALPLGACGGASDEKPASQRLPAVTLDSLDGGDPVDLSTLRGPLVINLWAAYCGPCRRELPIYAQFADKYAGQVDVVGIDWNDPQAQAARDLARRSGVDYPLYADLDLDINGQGPIPAIRGLPAIMLVDDHGDLVHFDYVEMKSLDQLVTLVNDNLGTSL